ncbi:MAG: Rpn family recombination-promoting nuclease/putative transposase [Fibrobacterota bacterium]
MKRNNDPHTHDTRYKKFFSSPDIFRQLLTQFIHEDFVKDLDLSAIKLVNTTNITHLEKRRYSDIMYSVKLKDSEVLVYILIEMQSSVDKFMAFRMSEYIHDYYRSRIRKTRKGKLPCIFPILIYSGNKKWNAPVQLQNLIRKDIPDKYIPSLQYYPVCINEFKTDNLVKIRSALSAGMIAENTEPDTVKRHFQIIGDIMREESPSLMKNFSDFILNLFEKTLETEYIYNEIDKFMPEKNMSIFTESFKKAREQERKEGIQQGLEEGKIEDAQKMLSKGYSIKDISEITGLSRRKISALKNK